jgi:hypothetical protein
MRNAGNEVKLPVTAKRNAVRILGELKKMIVRPAVTSINELASRVRE